MINGEAILAAVLSLRQATERGFQRLEAEIANVTRRLEKLGFRVDALETRLDRFEVKVLQRFDALDARFDVLDARLISVERG